MHKSHMYRVVRIMAVLVGGLVGAGVALGLIAHDNDQLHQRWGWHPGTATIVSRGAPVPTDVYTKDGIQSYTMRYDRIKYVSADGSLISYALRMRPDEQRIGYRFYFWQDVRGNHTADPQFHGRADMIVFSLLFAAAGAVVLAVFASVVVWLIYGVGSAVGGLIKLRQRHA